MAAGQQMDPSRIDLQTWVDETKPMLGQAKAAPIDPLDGRFDVESSHGASKAASSSHLAADDDDSESRTYQPPTSIVSHMKPGRLDSDEEENHPASSQPHPVARAEERSFAHRTGPLANANAPAAHPAFTPEILARRKEQWKEAAQKQIDAQIDAAGKLLIAKAQQAGGQLGATFVSEQFNALKKQFGDEALAVFPNSDKVKQLAAVYPARLQKVTQNVTT